MDLNAVRTAYWVGNYSQVIEAKALEGTEFAILKWKSIVKLTGGDVSRAATESASSPISELVKRALLLWSKAYKCSLSSPTFPGSSSSSSDISALKGIALEVIDSEERDHVCLLAAEGLLLLSALDESFPLLKGVKSSNMDCQVMFIDILLRLGQFQMARDRLEKMRIIPEWVDDIRFLLLESSICLISEQHKHNHRDDNQSNCFFSVTDCLYLFQELIQIHGSTITLVSGLAASFVLLGKFSEAQNILQSITEANEVVIQQNLLVLSILSGGDHHCSLQ